MMNVNVLEKSEEISYIDSKQIFALAEFKSALFRLLKDKYEYFDEIIFLCIGTDRSTGDSLGPLVGYKLSRMPFKEKIFIYGTLDNPVHAKNLNENIMKIRKKHINPLVIAIDASLGSMNHISYITVANGSLKPGAGVRKELPEVGNICITGIVNASGFMDLSILQNTRLSVVMQMAEIITSGIWLSISNLRITKGVKLK